MTDQTPTLSEFRSQYDTDSNAWWRLDCGHHMNLFDEALDALDAAREAIEAMQSAHESQLTRMTKERARLQRKVSRLEAQRDCVRAALAGHPRCDVHPDADPVSCGWKRAVADVQRALDAAEVQP